MQGRIKALGRKVADFDELVWEENRYDIMLDGLRLKFEQNADAQKALLSTGVRPLAEAKDPVRGNGLKLTDPHAKDQKLWTGLNLLGKRWKR